MMFATRYCGLFVVSLLAACKPPANFDSESKWAHDDVFAQYGLMNVEPDHAINVCDSGDLPGGAVADLKKAVAEWADAAGHLKHLTIQEGCNAENGDALVAAQIQGGGLCDQGAAAYSGPVGTLQYQVTYCNNSYTNSYDITVHEVGHLWGNCDRYGSLGGPLDSPQMGQDCSQTNRSSGPVLPSAMMAGGPNHPHKVTADDRRGMEAMRQREDIQANKLWAPLISDSSGGDTAPSGGGTQPSNDNQSVTPSQNNANPDGGTQGPTPGPMRPRQNNQQPPHNFPPPNNLQPPSNGPTDGPTIDFNPYTPDSQLCGEAYKPVYLQSIQYRMCVMSIVCSSYMRVVCMSGN